MQECLFSEPPGHEREPSWKPHQEVMPTAHSPTPLPPTLISSWCACMISFPSPVSPPTHPHYLLCRWENGEGVGDVPIGYAVHDTLIFNQRKLGRIGSLYCDSWGCGFCMARGWRVISYVVDKYGWGKKLQKEETITVHSFLPTLLFPYSPSLTWRKNVHKHCPSRMVPGFVDKAPDLRYYWPWPLFPLGVTVLLGQASLSLCELCLSLSSHEFSKRIILFQAVCVTRNS